MPYIAGDQRPKWDRLVELVKENLKDMPEEDVDGNLNYFLTRIVSTAYPRRYRHMNRAMGMLECVKQEFYRVVCGPYEDEKQSKNGGAHAQ